MNDLEQLLKLLESEYKKLSTNVEAEIMLSNKQLDSALTEQIKIQIRWERLSAKVASGYSLSKDNAEYEFAKAYTNAISDAYKDLSSTDAKFIAGCDVNYADAKKLENNYYRLRKEVEAVVDTIESRKYVLKDLTSSIINEVSKTIL